MFVSDFAKKHRGQYGGKELMKAAAAAWRQQQQRGGSGDNDYGYDAAPCGSWEDLADLINILPPDPADPESMDVLAEQRDEFQANVDQVTEGGDPDEQVYVALNVAQHYVDYNDDPPLGASAAEVRALNEFTTTRGQFLADMCEKLGSPLARYMFDNRTYAMNEMRVEEGADGVIVTFGWDS